MEAVTGRNNRFCSEPTVTKGKKVNRSTLRVCRIYVLNER